MAFIGEIERKSPVAHVLLVYAHEQVQIIKEQAPQIRRGTLDSVHLMRIAVRRLRSVLATYRTLLDAEFVIHLREELKWLGLILGSQRDAEVMGQRIKELIATEPFELTMAPISRWIDEHLESDFHIARLAVLKTLDDKRYLQLLKDLDALLAAP
ncbi:MAG TPA: CHAD domain-containing protein, partial [Candidatus Nanopelagicaceae bacterium]